MDSLVIPTLATERLWLRPIQESDFEDYAAMNGDPEVMRYLGGPWDRGRSWRHLAFLLGHWQLGRPGMWALEQKETGAFLGMVGFSEPEGWPGFELAGILARRWWGQGHATEATRAAEGNRPPWRRATPHDEGSWPPRRRARLPGEGSCSPQNGAGPPGGGSCTRRHRAQSPGEGSQPPRHGARRHSEGTGRDHRQDAPMIPDHPR